MGTVGTQLASQAQLSGLLAGPQSQGATQQTKSVRPKVALTIDDPSVDLGPFMTWQEANRRLLECFAHRKLKIALFVCGMRVDQPEGQELLRQWDEAGHLLCNHSYAHLDFNGPKVSYDCFESDFARNAPIIQPYRHRTALFRYLGRHLGHFRRLPLKTWSGFPLASSRSHGVLYKPEGNGLFLAVLYNHGRAPGMYSKEAFDALGLVFAKPRLGILCPILARATA